MHFLIFYCIEPVFADFADFPFFVWLLRALEYSYLCGQGVPTIVQETQETFSGSELRIQSTGA